MIERYKMKLLCDTHTHTIFSAHAYSTLQENISMAKARGLELLGSTDHFSAMQFTDPYNIKNYQYLATMHVLPEEWDGVRLLKGCEADIIDMEGHLFGYNTPVRDMITGDPFPDHRERSLLHRVIKSMDYVIASVHAKYFAKDASRAECTELYLRALENPTVLMLGHIGRSGLDFDLDPILLLAKELHKLIEINEHSLDTKEKITIKCRDIAIRCAELGVPIAVNSDAHVALDIGKLELSNAMLEEIHFPEELIMTRDRDSFLRAVRDAKLDFYKDY